LIERPNAEGRYPVREATDGELAMLIVWRLEEDARRPQVLQAASTLNRLLRNKLYAPYMGGHSINLQLDDDTSDAVERLKRRLAAAQEQAEPPADISAPEVQRFGPVGSSLRRRLSRGHR
ncbi:MAG: hypothetical protein P8Y53_24580, partial [Pseudolabrys sp.]